MVMALTLQIQDMPNKEDFDLHYQFKLYLERCQVDMKLMPADQLRETKRAFFGACGQMLILLRDDVAAFPEPIAVSIMKTMLDQVGTFWENEMKNQN